MFITGVPVKKRNGKQDWVYAIASTFGVKKDLTTAPARLAISTASPFVIVFAAQKTENWDTIAVQRLFVNWCGITRTEPDAKLAAFNVLLTDDNDYGSINSEFFLKYKLAEKWDIKAVYQFYFAEYKTNTIEQTAPDGTPVNSFRNKVNALGPG